MHVRQWLTNHACAAANSEHTQVYACRHATACLRLALAGQLPHGCCRPWLSCAIDFLKLPKGTTRPTLLVMTCSQSTSNMLMQSCNCAVACRKATALTFALPGVSQLRGHSHLMPLHVFSQSRLFLKPGALPCSEPSVLESGRLHPVWRRRTGPADR